MGMYQRHPVQGHGDAPDRQGISGSGVLAAEHDIHHPHVARQPAHHGPKPYSRAAFISAWLDQDRTVDEIAVQFGASKSQCRRRAKALGIPTRKHGAKRKPTPDAFIRAAWIAGVKSSDICRRSGIDDMTLFSRLRAMGLDLRGRGWKAKMTLMEFDALQLRAAMAASARETAAAMRDAEMVDNFQAGRWPARKAA